MQHFVILENMQIMQRWTIKKIWFCNGGIKKQERCCIQTIILLRDIIRKQKMRLQQHQIFLNN